MDSYWESIQAMLNIFVRCGYQVGGFDLPEAGSGKTNKLVEKAGVFVDVFRENMLDFRLEKQYDIIYSSGVFIFMPQDMREKII